METTTVRRGLTVGATLIALLATDTASAQESPPKWGPHLDLEGKAGNKRNIGEADVFVPLWQDADTLVFGNLRTRLDDNESREGNFGAGVRHMLPSGWNLGGYGYFDRRKTENGNYFNQATFGAEALSLDWDFRVNSYWPVGTTVRSLGTSTTSSASLSGTAVQVVTTGSTTEERALRGLDMEIGWRVPLFAADAGQQLRLYGGAYRFYADDVNPVQGPRARAELTFDEVPYLWEGSRLTLGAEAQHDGPRGGQVFGVARLRIPLQVFGESPSRLTPLERRMADPIVRDVDIVSGGRTVTQPSVVETATQTSGGSTITVLDSATTTGAALPGAVAAAGANSTVILSGTFNTTAATTLQAGQTLMGAGTLTVTTPSGRTATLTTPTATVAGDVSFNPTVSMGTNSTLTGLTVSNTVAASDAIAVRTTVAGATIANNTITATAPNNNAIGINQNGGSTTVRGNTITASSTGGAQTMALVVLNGSATVAGNTFSGSGATANNRYLFLDNSNIAAGSTGNVANAGVCAVNNAGTGSTVQFTNAAACGP